MHLSAHFVAPWTLPLRAVATLTTFQQLRPCVADFGKGGVAPSGSIARIPALVCCLVLYLVNTNC